MHSGVSDASHWSYFEFVWGLYRFADLRGKKRHSEPIEWRSNKPTWGVGLRRALNRVGCHQPQFIRINTVTVRLIMAEFEHQVELFQEIISNTAIYFSA